MTDRVCARHRCGVSLDGMRSDAMWCSDACRVAAHRAAKAEQSRNSEPSQKDRILRALRLNGSWGITQEDFLPPNVIDGFSKITRVGARIKDLRNDGVKIETDGERNDFAIYKVASAVSSGPASAPAPYPAGAQRGSRTDPPASSPPPDAGPDKTAGSLFDAPPAGPANALLGEDG